MADHLAHLAGTHLATFLVEIQPHEATIADVMWSHWGDEMPIHMALIVPFRGRAGIIHGVWPTGVTECTLTTVFTDRVVAYWRYPYIARAEMGAAA